MNVVTFVIDKLPTQYFIVEFPVGHCWIVSMIVVLTQAASLQPGVIVTFVTLFPMQIKFEVGFPHEATN